MDKASATNTIDTGSIRDWVKPKATKMSIHGFSAWRSAFCIKKESVKPPSCGVNRWTGGSLTQKTKGAFAVCWLR